MELRLDGRRALITGSSQGVGSAIARAIAAAGADVVIHGLNNDDHARRTLAECRGYGREAHWVAADLAAPDNLGVDALYEQANDCLPGIDLLVNNAGTYRDRPFLEMSAEDFRYTLRLNVQAPFFLTQRFARQWVIDGTEGRVLLIGSINGRLAEPNHAAYDTSKGGVEMMVKTLCVELAPHGIRINGLAPGLFRTPLTEPSLADPRLAQWMRVHTPNGRIPEPDVAGPAAVFLLSDLADHIQGHMLMVDGGMSAWQQPDPPRED